MEARMARRTLLGGGGHHPGGWPQCVERPSPRDGARGRGMARFA
ncbi:hypothetical protein EDWATA_01746 [Edwardsiella tarda ATCC 23685]|uniref:Uncharacterized protein n=1 Tax=Edwardsiella tarda ATCC 23685 TaxID=500638 RepID=D4F4S3_EDWTA|nr:hypothetical protein EDWATA_01746 [Edwardsiella tarda ATCC 23685]